LTQAEAHAAESDKAGSCGILDVYVRDDPQNAAENENPVKYPLLGFSFGPDEENGCAGTLTAYLAHDLDDTAEPEIYALVNEHVVNDGSLVGNAAYQYRPGSQKFMISCPAPCDYKDIKEKLQKSVVHNSLKYSGNSPRVCLT